MRIGSGKDDVLHCSGWGHLPPPLNSSHPSILPFPFQYYYGIKEVYLVGRCNCNGHSEHCDKLDPKRPQLWLCQCKVRLSPFRPPHLSFAPCSAQHGGRELPAVSAWF